MSEIIKDRQIVPDDWQVLRLADTDNQLNQINQLPDDVIVPEGKTIVPLAVWQSQHASLMLRSDIGVWLASSERAEALRDDVGLLTLIAVDFPRFSDGRGYSIAYNLRARLSYQGELRAIGDVLRDQLFYMQRVGFNAFAVRPDRPIHDAIKGLTDFSESYQTSIDQKTPLFRRVQRPSGVAL